MPLRKTQGVRAVCSSVAATHSAGDDASLGRPSFSYSFSMVNSNGSRAERFIVSKGATLGLNRSQHPAACEFLRVSVKREGERYLVYLSVAR